jgi:cytochrome c biogenesis protein CcmG/thiol:disulfide interchange protein DsbE
VATRRLPLSAVLAATAIALVAALATFAVLDRGDDGDAGPAAADEPAGQVDLMPAGELPASVAEVRLASLGEEPDAALGDLLTGKPVVVNFFASWCAPCVEEMPAFERVHRSVGDRVTIIGMANSDTVEKANATVEATGVTYPTYGDPQADAISYFGGLQMPTTVFIDATGRVLDVNNGQLTEAELRAKLRDLFGVAA